MIVWNDVYFVMDLFDCFFMGIVLFLGFCIFIEVGVLLDFVKEVGVEIFILGICLGY